MTRKTSRRGRIIPVVFFTFAAGFGVGWWTHLSVSTTVPQGAFDLPLPSGTSGDLPLPPGPVDPNPVDRTASVAAAAPSADPAPAVIAADSAAALAGKNLRLPIDNADVAALKGQFADRRAGGARGHEAVDILAPRSTPIHAVENGTIAKLFRSKLGGTTIYQFDPSGRFCYYYAHLERYAPGLREQQHVSRGDVIGFVGTSGNAPRNTPHLHFAIFELAPDKHWWEGVPLDPWVAFSH
jgi:murein DD-endopeptidase MepM/ murein hydrolase activator NlpD